MTLARMWRRQLFAASSVALVVPLAMVAALVLLALGGGFSQLGVLGQIFAGPPAPSAGPLAPGAVSSAGARAAGTGRRTGIAATVIPVIPVAQFVATRPGSGANGTHGRVAPGVPAPRTGIRSTGGAIRPGGLATRPVTGSPGGAGSIPGAPQPAPVSSTPSPSPAPGPAPAGPAPAPGPSPWPTPVDTGVKAVTSVTQHLPGPVGPVVTQAVQGAGQAAGGLPRSPGVPSRGFPPHGGPSQGLPSRGAAPRGFPSRGFPSRGGPSQGLPSRPGPSRGGPSRGLPSRGSPPTGPAPASPWRGRVPASPVTLRAP